MSVKVFFVLNFIVCCSIANILGVCQVQFPVDAERRPTVVKEIGSRRVPILHKPAFINLQDGEVLTAHCNTSFINPSTHSEESTFDIKCEHDQINGMYYTSSILVECDTLTWNMYESSAPFGWCPLPMVSYILAQPSGSGGFTILAGICYSFEDITVQSMHYVMRPKSSQYLSQYRFRDYTPSTKIQYILDNFISPEITLSMYDNPQIKHWMKFAKYESHSLIQNSHIYPDSNIQLGGLLDIAWWSGLRLGNWQLYEEALSQHIEKESLEWDILAGISGAVAAPIYKDSCYQNRTMVKAVDDMKRTMPLFVWHYLKSMGHESEHLVVIGVNSPFNEFYADKDLIFCNDICPQIGWLQKVHSTFHYKAMGVIFCCSVDDVKASRRLNGFPLTRKPTHSTPPPVQFFNSSSEVLDNSTESENDYDDDSVISKETEY